MCKEFGSRYNLRSGSSTSLGKKTRTPDCRLKPFRRRGVMNGALKSLRARKILPLLDILAKFNECPISHARKIFVHKANFKSMLVLSCLRMQRLLFRCRVKSPAATQSSLLIKWQRKSKKIEQFFFKIV